MKFLKNSISTSRFVTIINFHTFISRNHLTFLQWLTFWNWMKIFTSSFTNCNYYNANVDGKSVSNWKKKKWLGQAIEFEDKTLRTSIEVEAI